MVLRQGRVPERRRNHVLADAIDIGLIYWDVFGTEAARRYLHISGVDPLLAERVLTDMHRRWDQRF